MYNRYVPPTQTYAPAQSESKPVKEKYIRAQEDTQEVPEKTPQKFSAEGACGTPLGKLAELLDRDKSGPLRSLLSACRLETLDTGDLLLLLIVLLVLADGDDLELAITLGLMLLLGLGSQTKKDPDEMDRPDRDLCSGDSA